jgi:hypothetical protein
MGELVRFPVRLRPIQPMTAEQVEIRDALIIALRCECGGRGFTIKGSIYGIKVEPCPCGGDEENRIDPNEPDYPGAA